MLAPYSIVVDRVCGHAELEVHVAADRKHTAWLRMPMLRGFEALLCGRPGEEIAHLASRISAICPWPHHLAALTAVENAMGVVVPPTAQLARELGLLLSNLSDRILLFYVTNAPDVVEGENPDERSFFNLLNTPHMREAIHLRTRLQRLLNAHTTPALYVGSIVAGGLSRSLDEDFVHTARSYLQEIRSFCQHSMQIGREQILPRLTKEIGQLEDLKLPMLGSVHEDGSLALWEGLSRYMLPDGSYEDIPPQDFMDDLVEEYADWTQCAFPHRSSDGPVCLDPERPSGMYRVGPLARINACNSIATPLAQAALEEFRRENGERPQATLLAHWARFIEMLHCCERAEEILNDPELLGKDVRQEYILPCSGTGVARIEAPRGSLFYKVRLDPQGMVQHCDIITPTTQNNAAMNVALTQAARKLIKVAPLTKDDWHKLSMCLRAYDPCPACAVH